jgi:hypothetical protein
VFAKLIVWLIVIMKISIAIAISLFEKSAGLSLFLCNVATLILHQMLSSSVAL